MAYEITPHDFCLIVKNPKCKGTEVENGDATEGHSGCNWCKGNYFVGGECNYGGRHKMKEDLRQINKNFRAFDALVKQQVKLSKSKNKNEFEKLKKTLLNSFAELKRKCEEESAPSANSSPPPPLRPELVSKQKQASKTLISLPRPNQPESSLTKEEQEQSRKIYERYWNQFTEEEKKEIQNYNRQVVASQLPKTSFFYGSCIGLDGTQSQFSDRIKDTFRRLAREMGYYIKQVQKSSWEQLQAFQEKLKKLDKLSSEATQLTKEWKEETDPIKKAKLFALLSQKNQEIRNLQAELKKDPVYSLYSQEKNDELANIVKNIFHGKETFFTWKKKSSDNNRGEAKSEKYLGFIPKEIGKNVLIIAGGLLGLLLIWWLIKRKFNE